MKYSDDESEVSEAIEPEIEEDGILNTFSR